MTINDIMENYADISNNKKWQKMKQILAYIEDNENDPDDDLLHDLLNVASVYESEDYFGTEGLK